MRAREQVVKVLEGLPAGVVRWAADPVEEPPRLPSGIEALDRLLGGGWPRGRVSVLAGHTRSTGATSLLVRTLAVVTRSGGLVAFVDGDDSLDPASWRCAGVDLAKVLWVRGPLTLVQGMKAVEEVLLAGGFEVVAVRLGEGSSGGAMGTRIARAAERARAVTLVLGGGGGRGWRIPGALVLEMEPVVPLWGGQGSKVLVGTRVRFAREGQAGEGLFWVPEALPWASSSREEMDEAPQRIRLHPRPGLSVAGPASRGA